MGYIARKGDMLDNSGELIGSNIRYSLEPVERLKELEIDLQRIIDAASSALNVLEAQIVISRHLTYREIWPKLPRFYKSL